MSFRVVIRRLLGFGVAPIASLLSPLLALPILARTSTLDEWSALAIAQALGGIAALAVSCGWSVVGPARAARSDPADWGALWLASVRTRAVALAIVMLPLALLTSISVPDSARALGISVAMVTAMTGFSLTWFAVGTGKPKLLVLFDAVPRSAGSVAGATLAAATGTLLVYPAVFGLATLVPIAAFTQFHRRRTRLRPRIAVDVPLLVQGMATEVIAGSYSVGAAALVSQTGQPATVATFSSGERLARVGSVGISVLGSALQGWIAEERGREFVRRAGLSAVLHTLVGMTGFLVLWQTGPWLSDLLFGSRFAVAAETTFWFGVYYLLWSLETVTGRHVLANQGEAKMLLTTTLFGSVLGIVLIPVLTSRWGVTGGAMGLACAMGTIVALQLPVAANACRKNWRLS